MKNLRVFVLFFTFLLFSYSAFSAGENYYKILEISKTASLSEIKQAYKRQASKWHPDRHNTEEDKKRATEKMAEINIAYEVLKNSQKRQRYDQFGHQNWTKTSKNQERDFYSEAFKDIFNKTETVSSRPISQKSILLVKGLMMFDFKDSDYRTTNEKIDTFLKEFLNEIKIFGLNKQTRNRIKQNIIAPYVGELKSIMEGKESQENTEILFKEQLRKLISEIENKHVAENITAKKRQAIELFYQFSFFNQRVQDFYTEQKQKMELLNKQQEKKITAEEQKDLNNLQRRERKDISIFKKILSALGLPGQTHHELLLRSYLDALKNSLFSEKFGESERLLLTSSRLNPTNQKFYMEDKEILKTLNRIKANFDAIQYENLRAMANPFKFNFLKNFPGQFIVFQAAIGASLYRQSLTDPYFYGADRNPEMLAETMSHSLTPMGAVSFFIFVAVSQQINYRLYGWGRRIDGKSLGKISFNGKTLRTIAPGAGLGLGFFVSAIFDELRMDPHLRPCMKSLYKKSDVEELMQSHSDSCESFYNNWSRSDKWKHYGVDILTLIGSGILSHKFVNSILYVLRLTNTGSNLLIGMGKTLGLRVTAWFGFFANMYFFMEFHKILDKYVGHPLKERLSAGGVKNSLVDLTQYLNQAIGFISYYNQKDDYLNEEFNKAGSRIKALGVKFKSWTEIAGRNYNQSASLWSQQTNELLAPYESSTELLKSLFVLSQPVKTSIYENNILNSEEELYENNIMNNTSDELINFNSLSGEYKPEHYYNKYCDKAKELPIWSNFCMDSRFFENEELIEIYNEDLFLETGQLISDYLKTVSLNKTYNFKPINYISLKNDEMFSSDLQYSVEKMSYEEKFELSRILIKASLKDENSLYDLELDQMLELRSQICTDFFPSHKTNVDDKQLYDYCYRPNLHLTEIKETCTTWFPEDQINYEGCIDFFSLTSEEIISSNLRLKLLKAGVYLLKKVIFDLQQGAFATNSEFTSYSYDHLIPFGTPNNIPALIFDPILDLLEIMTIYKKGEKQFVITEESFKQYKNQLSSSQEKDQLEKQFELTNPYILLKNMVCGSDEQQDDFLFRSKKFFKSDELFVYNFSSNQYESIDRVCKNTMTLNKHIHKFLFNTHTQLEGQSYENLYLVIEQFLKNYSSPEDLTADFQNLSQDQLDNISSKISQDLDNVTENYYKDMIEINSPVNKNSSLKDFLNYYGHHLVLTDIRSFTGDMKGLEISIFQVNYWLETLKKFLLVGEKNDFNTGFDSFNEEFSFNLEDFEKMQEEILSLFQSYNDTFQKAQGPYFSFIDRDKMEELRKQLEDPSYRKVSVLDSLKSNHSFDNPPLLSSTDILSHVLAHSITNFNNPGMIGLITTEQTFFQGWEQLIVSILTELNKSINNFFIQMIPLQLKDSFEDRTADFRSDVLTP
ncbi:MAG: DnaJ domain-containing protein [Bdellovibrionaceae bacterium]|nr:DnaJ domain-containing protein [Pseudobdellovibrionaceae bacterium]